MFFAIFLFALSLLSITSAKLPHFPCIDKSQITISGMSSGAYQTVQMAVAYSSVFSGAGIFAGGPYYCARSNVENALHICMKPPKGEYPPLDELIGFTDSFALSGTIDPTFYMKNSRFYFYSGLNDTVVHQPVVETTAKFFHHYAKSSNIKTVFSHRSEHLVPTINQFNGCLQLQSPYIGKCDYDGIGDMLQWLYNGKLVLPTSESFSGKLHSFSQSDYIPLTQLHGMSDTGYYYVPPGCENNTSNKCLLHVALHGCSQSHQVIGFDFIEKTGYLPYADANNIIILFPQAHSIEITNPYGCWDWWGYDIDSVSTYMLKVGPQPFALFSMIQSMSHILIDSV